MIRPINRLKVVFGVWLMIVSLAAYVSVADASSSAVDQTSAKRSSHFLFVDSSVADYATLLTGLTDPALSVVVLDPHRDGLHEIATVLQQQEDITAVHVLSHGHDGALQLGNRVVGSDALHTYAHDLQIMRAALAPGGDILLYGCNLAATPTGLNFLDEFAQATGADVAASADLTGARAGGGDWDLEVQTGLIEATIPFNRAAQAAFAGLLGTITVDAGGGGDYTTIQAAVNNASPGDEIVVNDGTYNESINLNNMGSAIGGSPGDITIRAANASLATVNGGAGAAFSASTFAGDVTLQDFVLDRDAMGAIPGDQDGVVAINNLSGVVTIIGNDFTSGYGANGIALTNDTAGIATSVLILNNTFTNGADNGDAMLITPGLGGVAATWDIVIDNNSVSGQQDDGIAISIETTGVVTARITNNQLSSPAASGDAIDLFVGAGATAPTGTQASFFVDNNTITNWNQGDGILINIDGVNTVTNGVITNNTISGTRDQGINLDSDSTSSNTTLNLLIANNNISNSGQGGIELRPFTSNTADLWNVTVDRNTITSPNTTSGLAGIYIDANGTQSNYTLNVAVTNNEVTTPTSGDYLVDQANGSTVNMEFSGNTTNSSAASLTQIGTVNSVADAISDTIIPANLGDFVWNDSDGNGIQGSEAGIGNVALSLTGTESASGAAVNRSTLSDPNGKYLFPGLLPGSYVVTINLPTGFTLSTAGQGGNGALDSDFNPSTHQASVTLTTDNFDLDAGLSSGASAETNVTLAGGILTITDANGGASNDHLTISHSGGNYTITDSALTLTTAIAGASGDGTNSLTIPDTGITSIVFDTQGGNDTLTVDFSSGDPIPSGGITFNGGNPTTGPGDSMVLQGGGPVATVVYTFTNASDGAIDLAGYGVINYTGLEPIASNISATDVSLTYSTAAETITVANAGGGQTTVDSTVGESVTFNDPSGTLTINGGDTGVNTVNVGALASNYPANLLIYGGSGGGTVNFNGALTLAANKALTVDALTVNTPNAASDLAASGTGSIIITATRNIVLSSGSSLAVVDGALRLTANATGATAGNFKGIDINNAIVETTGTGPITLTGVGANNSNANNDQVGVHVRGTVRSTASSAGAGAITIDGTGGSGASTNYGVRIDQTVSSVAGPIQINGQGGSGSTLYNIGVDFLGGQVASTGTGVNAATIIITGTGGTGTTSADGIRLDNSGQVNSVDGAIQLTGHGGATSGSSNLGVHLRAGSQVAATGVGAVTVNGIGGTGTNSHHGVYVTSTGSKIAVATGLLTLSGVTSASGSDGIQIDATSGGVLATGAGAIQITGSSVSPNNDFRLSNGDVGGASATGAITLIADRINLAGGAIDSDGALTIRPRTASSTIGLGAAATGTLNLNATELALLQNGFSSITIGDATNGAGAVDINTSTFNDPVTIVGAAVSVDGLNAATNAVTLTARTGSITDGATGTDITGTVTLNGNVTPGASPGQLVIDGDVTLNSSVILTVEINSAGTPGTTYDQLQVIGSNRTINLNNATLAIVLGYTPATGDQFVLIDNVDAGSTVSGLFNGLAEGAIFTIGATPFKISYTGGDGNDVVLTALIAAKVNGTLYATLQSAIDAANSGDTIQLLADTLTLASTVHGLSQLGYITKSLTLAGGCDNTFTTCDPSTPTTLDAGSLGRALVISGTIEVTLTNMIITGGDATAGGGDGNGGGVLVDGSTVFLLDTTIDGNRATNGGGIYLGSTVTCGTGCSIANNAATANGGGVFINATTLTSTFHLNGGAVVTNTANDDGGGIYVDDALAVYTQTLGTVGYNVANLDGDGNGEGGGIFIRKGLANLTGGQIISNTARAGGGIYNANNNLKLALTNTTVISNTANNGGGGLFAADAVTVADSYFAGNNSSGSGAALRVGGALTMTATQIISNTASNGRGGGVYVVADAVISSGSVAQNRAGNGAGDFGGGLAIGGNLTISGTQVISNQVSGTGGGLSVTGQLTATNTTIAGNWANTDGGGIYGSNTMTITNSQILSNTAGGSGGGVYSVSSDAKEFSSSLIQNNRATTGSGGGMNGSGTWSLLATQVISNAAGDDGGGIRISTGELNAMDSLFQLNDTAISGGGASLGEVIFYLDHTDFISNTAVADGGAISGFLGEINGGRFQGNQSDDYGGALSAVEVIISAAQFVNNRAQTDGGGVSVADGVITSTEFTGNNAAAGGGLYIEGTLTVTDTQFTANSATNGGALYNYGIATVAQVTFTQNYAANAGGALYNGGALDLARTFFATNQGQAGGGLALFEDAEGGNEGGSNPSTVVNTIFVNNATSGVGAAVAISTTQTESLYHNTIVSQTQGSGASIYITAGDVALVNTIIATATTGVENVGGAVAEDYNLFYNVSTPLSGAFTSGGNTQLNANPYFLDPATDDYQLTNLSAAINQGSDVGVTDDYAGDSRPKNGLFDIGAFETALQVAEVNGVRYTTLQAAVDAANPGDTIKVIAAILDEPETRDGLTQLALITKSVTIEGGYALDFSAVDPNTPTTLDAVGLGRALVISGTIPVTLTNLILTGGNATVAGGDPNGGGLLIQGSDVTLVNTQITGNIAEAGGGVHIGSTLTCGVGCSIDNNTATDGGGIFVNSTGATSALILSGGQIANNSASDHGGGIYVDDVGAVYTQTAGLVTGNDAGLDGGGIYVNDGAAALSGGSLEYNQAGNSGGGLAASSAAQLTLANTDFLTNTAGSDGGGLYVDGDVTVQGGLFQGNDAFFGGGLAATSSATVSGTQFINNYAVDLGGGIVTFEAYAEDALFQENSTNSEGGGIFAVDIASLTNTDFISNTAVDIGGGLSADMAEIQGGLFQGNVSDNGGGVYAYVSATINTGQFISNNAGNDGGGLYSDGTADVGDALFQANSAGDDGGGLYGYDSITSSATQFIGNSADDHGGGIYGDDSVRISASDFISNTSINDGAGVHAYGAVWVANSLFQENQSDDDGGGINAEDILTLVNTTLISNISGDDGGGAYVWSEVSITGGTFQNNSAADLGGGLISRGYTTIEDTTFISNTAVNNGGGVLSTGPAFVTEVTFTDNSSTKGGALAVESYFDLERSWFQGNQADTGGALHYSAVSTCDCGLFYGLDTSYVINNIFADNQATLGGSIALTETQAGVEITHNTIVSQSVGSEEAIYLFDAAAEILDTIIANYATGVTNDSATASEDYNLIYGATTPLAGTFTSGGNTQIGLDPDFVDWANDDYHLNKTSPAVDTGAFAGVTDDYDRDYRPQGMAVEIGALEAEAVNLAIIKAAPATVYAGEAITYTLMVYNQASVAATNVAITDTLPADVTFGQVITYTGGICGTGPTVITCTVPSLAPGGTISFTVVVTSDSGLAPGTSLENVAEVDSDLPEALLSDNRATADSTILGSAELTLRKSAAPSATVGAGGRITYTIVVTNSGPSVAQDVTIYDQLPADLSLLLVTAERDGDTRPARCGGLTCAVGDLAVGQTATVTLYALVDAGVAEGTVLTNTASVFSTSIENDLSDNEDSAVVTVTTVADLTVTKSGSTTAAIGGDISYLLLLENSGPATANGVVVSDTLPAELQDATVTSRDLSANSCAIDTNNLLTCTIDTLRVGEIVAIDIDATVAATTTASAITNTVLVTSTNDLSGTTDSHTTTLVTAANLTLVKDATATVYAGETITYTLTVYNAGPSAAQEVVVTDTLPSGVTLVSATGGDGCGVGAPLTCTVSTLDVGATVTFTLVATSSTDLAEGASLENRALVAAATNDLNPSNNTDRADTTILNRAELTLSKSGPATITAGDEAVYTLVATNSGPSAAQSVVIADALPTDLTLTSAQISRDGSAPALCGGATCQLGDLAVGEVVTVTLTASAASDLSDGDTLTNTATIFTDSAEDDLSDNRAEAVATVTTNARLRLNKRELADPVVVSAIGNPDEITYILTIRSDGPSDAANVILTDTMPAGVESGGGPIIHASYAPSPNASVCTGTGSSQLVCDLGAIPAGETIEILVPARVTDDAGLCSTSVTNDALVTWEETSGLGSNSASATTRLLCQGDIDLQKEGPTSVDFGDSYQYTLTVHNIGPSPVATNTLDLTEYLPAALDYTGIASQSGSCAFIDPGAASGVTALTFINGATLDTGDSCELVLDVTVRDDPDVCTTGFIFNQAQATVADRTDDRAQATWLTAVSCETTLAISKVADFDTATEPLAGDWVDYLITITNTGVVTAFDPVLTDYVSLPLGGARLVDFYSTGSEPIGACTVSGLCQLNDLAPGDSVTVVATVEVDSDRRGELLEQEACVEATNADQTCDSVNNTIYGDARVAITKDTLYAPFIVRDSGSSEISDDGHYLLRIANLGASDADSLVITDQLPTGMVISSDPVRTSSYIPSRLNCSGSVGTDLLNCRLRQPLRVGETLEIIVPVGFDAGVTDPASFCGTTIDNQAFVEWDDDFDTANNWNSSNTLSIEVLCQGAIDLQKSAPTTVDYADAVGSGFTYTLTVANIGTSPIVTADLTIVDTLPDGLSFVTPASGGSCGFSVNIVGNQIQYINADSLAAGESCTATYSVQLEDNPDFCENSLLANSAQATVGSFPFGTDQALALTTINCAADLEISKAVTYPNGATSVSPGEVITFTLTVTNTGPAPAVGMVVQDLPLDFDYTLIDVQAPPSYTQSAGLTFVRDGALAGGGVEEFTLVMRVNEPGSDSGSPANSAYVTADNAGPASDSVPVTIAPAADLRVVKTALADTVLAGDIAYFHIEVINNGPADIRAPSSTFTLTDGLSGTASIETVSGALCIIDSTTTITCADLELAEGDKLDLLVGVRVDSAAANGTTITNTAQIDLTALAGFTDTVSANNVATATMTVINSITALTIDKQLVSTEIVAGAVVSYQLVITNSVLYTATDLALTDNISAPLSGAAVIDMSITGSSFGYTPQGGECSDSGYCALPDLPPAAVVTVTVQVAVDSDQAGTLLENAACVDATNAAQSCDSTSDWITAQSALRITKLAPVTVTAGSEIAYTLVVSNAGPSDAQSVVVTDTLPGALTATTATVLNQPGACTISGDDITCALGVLAAGAVTTIDIAADVASSATGLITNTAYLTSTTFITSPVASNTTSTVVAREADLALVKTATATVVAGETITYSLSLYNDGPSDAFTVIVTDTLPDGVTLDSAIGGDGCDAGPNPVTCTVSSLTAGGWMTFTVVVTTDPDLEPGISLENTATVAAITPDSDSSNNTATADTSILSQAALALEKSGPTTVTAGTQLTYTMVVTNSGPSVAQNVVIADQLPVGVEFVNAAVIRSSGSAPTLCGGATCQVGDLAVNEVVTMTFVALADADLSAGATLTNTATVFSDSTEADLTDNRDNVATTVATEAEITISKSDLTDPVGPNDSLLYEIVVRNAGPSDAQSVIITDTLDSNVTLSGASDGCLQSGSDLVCTVGTLAADAYATYLVGVRVNGVVSGTILTNIVTATTTTTDPTLPNTASVTTTVENINAISIDLALTKTGAPTTVNAGEEVTYTLQVSNLGDQTATKVKVVDVIPAGTRLVTMTVDNPNDSSASCLRATCTLGEVITGTNVATVTAVLAVANNYTGDTIVNQAYVTAGQRDPDAGNNTASATTTITTLSSFEVVKSAPAQALAGELLLYQVRATNRGPSMATDLTISDTLPISTTFVTASPICTESGGLVTCTIERLGVDASAGVLIQVRADQRIISPTLLTNTAAVSATNAASTVYATATTTVTQDALNPTTLQLTKAATPATVNAGEQITYTLTVTNAGPAAATNVRLVDMLSPATATDRASASQGLCSLDGVCELGDLAVGASAQITLVVTVASNTPASILTNQAVVAATNPGSYAASNVVSTTVTVSPALSITKVGPAAVHPADTIAYQIIVSNRGPSDAIGVVVSDTLPAVLESVSGAASQGSCTNSGGSFACALGTVPAGATAYIAVNGYVAADATGVFTNTATLVGTGLTANVTTTVLLDADLALVKRATPTVNAGEPITYTLTVYNNGPSAATNVIVTDTLPSGVTLASAGGGDGCGTGPNPVTCTVSNLSAGQSVTFTLVVTSSNDLETGLSLENAAVATADVADSNLSNNQATADTSILTHAALTLQKQGPVAVIAGAEMTYTIVIRNSGPSAARGVVMEDDLPAGVQLVDAWVERTGATPALCGNSACQVGALAVDEMVTVTLTALTNAELAAGTVLTNTATVFSVTPEDNLLDNSDSVTTTVTVQTNLTLTKQGPLTANAGSAIDYTIVVQNDGPSVARNVAVSDLLPAELSNGTATVLNRTRFCIGSSTLVSCDVGDLAVDDRVTIQVTAQIAADATGVITNTAAVTSTSILSTVTASHSTMLIADADLRLDKRAPATVGAGDRFTYTLAVYNAGPSAAQGVVVTDMLPAGVTLANAGSGAGCGVGPNPITCTINALGAGEWITFTLTVTADASLAPGLSLENVATVMAATLDHDLSNNQDNADTNVIGRAELALTKQGPATVVAGLPLTYTIVVTNSGPSMASGLSIEDALPTGLSLTSATVRQPGVAPALCGGLTCQVTDLAAGGAVTVTVVALADADLTDGVLITNTATVFGLLNEIDLSDNRATVTTTVMSQAQLTLDKRGPITATAGSDLAYTIVIRNLGPSLARNVVVSDTLPVGLSNITAAAINWPNACGVTGNQVRCDLAQLAVNEAVQIGVQAHVVSNAAGSLTNTAYGTSSTAPALVISDTVTTVLQQVADLALTKVATATVYAGGTINYLLTVTNLGPSDAQGAVVTDTLPGGVTLLASTGCQNDPAGAPVCVLGDLVMGETRLITLTTQIAATVDVGTSLENVAVVGAQTADLNLTNNRDSADTTVLGKVSLSLTKDGPASVVAGAQITYTIVVRNDGPASAPLVDVKDQLPLGVNLLAATIQRTGSGPALCSDAICQLSNLAVGESATMVVVAVVDPALPYGTVLTNTATVFSNGAEDDLSDNSDSVTTTVAALADLSVVKIDLRDPVEPMAGFMYEIAVTNAGPSDAVNVVVTDTLGSDLSFVSISPDCLNNGRIVVCTLPTLAAGQTARYLLAVQTGDVVDGTILQNQIVVQSAIADPDPSNNSDSETTTVLTSPGPSADLALVKRALAAQVTAGEMVTYTLVVSNAGPATATGVQVLEHFPPETTIAEVSVTNPDDALAFCSTGGVCTLGRLRPGTTATITLTLKVGLAFAGATLHNSAAVVGDQVDYVSANNVDSADVTVQPAPQLLVVEKSADKLVALAGDALVYTIKVMNNGAVPAYSVRVTDTLPSGVTYVEDTLTCGSTLAGCLLGDLAPGQVRSFQVAVTIDSAVACGSSLTNTVQIGAANVRPDPATDHAEVLVVVSCEADLSITALATPAGDTPAGQAVHYRLLLDNLGPSTAHKVTLDLDLLAGGPVTLTKLVADGDSNQPTATCSVVPPVAVNGIQARLALSCTLGAPLAPQRALSSKAQPLIGLGLRTRQRTRSAVVGRWAVDLEILADRPLDLSGVATVTGAEADSRRTNNLAQLQTSFVCNETSNADLGLTKRVLQATDVVAGALVVYALDYANHTTDAAACVTLVETVPAHSVFVAAESDPRWNCLDGAPAGATCQIYLGTVPGGAAAQVRFATQLDQSIGSNTPITITNTAQIEGSPTEANQANNVASAELNFIPTALDEEDETVQMEQIFLPIIQNKP
ncbi:MAG: DUF4347 domain-containing protein [Caldilineaceae bacterium]